MVQSPELSDCRRTPKYSDFLFRGTKNQSYWRDPPCDKPANARCGILPSFGGLVQVHGTHPAVLAETVAGLSGP